MTYPCPIVEEPSIPWRAAATTHFNATTAGTTLSYLLTFSIATARSLLHASQSPYPLKIASKPLLNLIEYITVTPPSQQHVFPGQSPGPGLPT